MKIGFFIANSSECKTLGPIIDESLKQNHTVYVFFASSSINGFVKKGQNFLSFHTIPKFRNGIPNLISVTHPINLYKKVVDSNIEVIFFHMGFSSTNFRPIEWLSEFYENKSNIQKISIASHYYDICLAPLEIYEYFDKIIILNQHAKQVHYDVLISKGYKKEEIQRFFKKKCIVAGSPLFDNLLNIKNNDLNRDKLLLLYPAFFSPFEKTVMLKHYKISILQLMRFPYKDNVFNYFSNFSFLELINSLNEYCMFANIEFHSKSRFKDPKYYKEHLDKICNYHFFHEETSHFPFTKSQEMMKDARVVISSRSFGVMEAVALGIPAINIQQPFNDKILKTLDPKKIFINQVRESYEGGLFNFHNCVTSINWKELHKINLHNIINNTINSYSEISRLKYIKKFINPCTQKNSSQKILEAVTLKI